MEFVGCFNNYVVSVYQFQLENSVFLGNGQVMVNGTVLSIEDSTANLERVVFSSIIDAPPHVQELPYPENCTAAIILTVKKVTGILLDRSSITITRSQFEGNNVGPIGGIIYDEFGSSVTIVNTKSI